MQHYPQNLRKPRIEVEFRLCAKAFSPDESEFGF